MPKLLTKSKYITGLQCPKCLWTAFNEPDKFPKADASTQHRFDEGHKVGELAKKLYPEGIDVSFDNFMDNVRRTKKLVKERKTLFEPGFMADRLFCRGDILTPAGKDEWDVIEVKSSTKVKETNLHDVSFQKHVYRKSGLKIRNCYLAFINNQFVKNGKINPNEFFILEDISKEAEEAGEGIEARIKEMEEIISSKKSPETCIGKHCKAPYDCRMKNHCWEFMPEAHVFQLYRGGKKCFELFENGVQSLEDIPEDYKLDVKQEIQRECHKTGKPHINKQGIKKFFDSLKYPLYYLDFETYSTAIPLFDGTKPYQNIPFQFSLHVVDKKGGTKHYSFLAEGQKDPRPEFARELKKVLGNKGSIIVYNQSFEIGRLKETAEALPEYADWVKETLPRIIDLLTPFRNFDYYNPLQKGSASIKKVLPALTGKSYTDLEINNGWDASIQYFNTTFKETTPEEKQKVRENLLEYCGLDTEGMVWVVGELEKQVS